MATAKWTILVYMAGDNNLQGAGVDDLAEMQKVGSTDDVQVLVQFDTEQNKTTRYRIERGRLNTLQEMPGVDCGDPAVLTDFIKWGVDNYPAEHYLLDIWNHGGGWENLPVDYDYEQLRSSKPALAKNIKRLKRSVFRTTARSISDRDEVDRAIAIDVGAHDYLDTQETRKAIAAGFGARPLDLLGCDACLMNMVEVCYELKGTTKYVVGSEQTEPGSGWPYTEILGALTKKPSMSPADLACLIARDYGAWYQKNGDPRRDGSATQSALDMAQLQPLADAISALADAFTKDLAGVAGQVSLARDKAQKFEYPEYIDLGDFLNNVMRYLPGNPGVQAAAQKALDALQPKTGSGFVIANTFWGPTVSRASGVSIYFPSNLGDPRVDFKDYKDLAFGKENNWRGFLDALSRF